MVYLIILLLQAVLLVIAYSNVIFPIFSLEAAGVDPGSTVAAIVALLVLWHSEFVCNSSRFLSTALDQVIWRSREESYRFGSVLVDNYAQDKLSNYPTMICPL